MPGFAAQDESNSAQLAGAPERTSHVGAIQIFPQVHERKKRAEDARFQVIGERESTGGYPGEALAMFGDELHDLALAIVRGVAERSLAAHARAAVFHRQREMQHTQLMLAQSRRHLDFAAFIFASVHHEAPRWRA